MEHGTCALKNSILIASGEWCLWNPNDWTSLHAIWMIWEHGRVNVALPKQRPLCCSIRHICNMLTVARSRESTSALTSVMHTCFWHIFALCRGEIAWCHFRIFRVLYVILHELQKLKLSYEIAEAILWNNLWVTKTLTFDSDLWSTLNTSSSYIW